MFVILTVARAFGFGDVAAAQPELMAANSGFKGKGCQVKKHIQIRGVPNKRHLKGGRSARWTPHLPCCNWSECPSFLPAFWEARVTHALQFPFAKAEFPSFSPEATRASVSELQRANNTRLISDVVAVPGDADLSKGLDTRLLRFVTQ